MAAATLLIDLDGTLWNSRPWYAETIARLSGGCSLQILRELEGGANVVRLAEAHGVTKSRLTRAVNDDGASMELYEGVLQTLPTLRQNGCVMGVVSNLPGWLAIPLLQTTGIESYFAATVTPRRGLPAKPKPHGIRQILSQMGREGNAMTWFVGDGVVDAEASLAAGVQFAWASYGYDAEAPSTTKRVLKRFDEVLDL